MKKDLWQGYVISPWQFSLFMDGEVSKGKVKDFGGGVGLQVCQGYGVLVDESVTVC